MASLEKPMRRSALLIIRDEHASLSAMLRSLLPCWTGPEPDGIDQHERFFDVLRAMLFYIGEFPEKQHHPKESNLLFPRVARVAPATMAPLSDWNATTWAARSVCANWCTC